MSGVRKMENKKRQNVRSTLHECEEYTT